MIGKTLTSTFTTTLLALVFSMQASATVIIGFEINSTSSLPLFTQTVNDTNTITDDTLSASATVDLTITVGGDPIPTFNDAAFQYDASLNSVTQDGNYLVLSYQGTFSFAENGTGDNIVTGNFNDMKLVFLAPGGNILFPIGLTANTNVEPLLFLDGSALDPFLPEDMQLRPKQTVNFTVDLFNTDNLANYIASTQEGLVPAYDATFSSSLSATSQAINEGIVPEPATISIALLGLALMVKRRRTA